MDKHFEELEDLLSDEEFLAWYFKTDEEAVASWEARMASAPALQQLTDAASHLLKQMPLQDRQLPAAQVDLAHHRLMTGIQKDTPVVKMRSGRWLVAVAASILIILSIGVIKFFRNESSIRTAYGQVQAHQLPDGSEVTLNANSKIIVTGNWQEGKDREVSLDGEAFFQVKHTKTNSRFIVHTNRFDIIVTGTQFNVVNRKERSNVLLKEGSVIIRSGDGEEVYMKPGEFVDAVKQRIQKKNVKESQVMAWTKKKIEFENTSMKEVAAIIHEHYGIDVTLASPTVAEKKISGIMPNDNLDVLIQALEALDFVIEKNKDEILIKEAGF